MSFSEFLSAANVLVAAVYAYLTYRIVKTSREQTEAVIRPYITITHRLSRKTLLSLYIKNTGRTNAERLRLQIDRDFFQVGNKANDLNIANNHAFKNELHTLPPNAELKFSLMSTVALEDGNSSVDGQPPVFTITATYSFADKTVTEKTTVDLRPYSGTFMPDSTIQDRLDELREEVKGIRGLLDDKTRKR